MCQRSTGGVESGGKSLARALGVRYVGVHAPEERESVDGAGEQGCRGRVQKVVGGTWVDVVVKETRLFVLVFNLEFSF